MSGAIRKTRKRYERVGDYRFLTFSCYHRLALFNNDAIKDAFVDQLAMAREKMRFQLAGYVVMPEHVHLLLQPLPPEWPVPRILRHLKGAFAHRVLKRWKQLNAPVLPRLSDSGRAFHFWQEGGGYDRNIYSIEACKEKIVYMHANPIARRLVTNPTDWKWSSARWYEGLRDGALPMDSLRCH